VIGLHVVGKKAVEFWRRSSWFRREDKNSAFSSWVQSGQFRIALDWPIAPRSAPSPQVAGRGAPFPTSIGASFFQAARSSSRTGNQVRLARVGADVTRDAQRLLDAVGASQSGCSTWCAQSQLSRVMFGR